MGTRERKTRGLGRKFTRNQSDKKKRVNLALSLSEPYIPTLTISQIPREIDYTQSCEMGAEKRLNIKGLCVVAKEKKRREGTQSKIGQLFRASIVVIQPYNEVLVNKCKATEQRGLEYVNLCAVKSFRYI